MNESDPVPLSERSSPNEFLLNKLKTPLIQDCFSRASRSENVWASEQQVVLQKLGKNGQLLLNFMTPEARGSGTYITRSEILLMAEGIIQPTVTEQKVKLANQLMKDLIKTHRPHLILMALKKQYPEIKQYQKFDYVPDFVKELSEGKIQMPDDFDEKVDVLKIFDDDENIGDSSKHDGRQTPLMPIVKEVVRVINESSHDISQVQKSNSKPEHINQEETQLVFELPQLDEFIRKQQQKEERESRTNYMKFKRKKETKNIFIEAAKSLQLSSPLHVQADFLGAGRANLTVRVSSDQVARIQWKNDAEFSDDFDWALTTATISQISKSNPSLRKYFPRVYSVGSTTLDNLIKISGMTAEQTRGGYIGEDAKKLKNRPQSQTLTVDPDISVFTDNTGKNIDKRTVYILENLSQEKGWQKMNMTNLLKDSTNGSKNAVKMVRAILEMQTELSKQGMVLRDFKNSFAMRFDGNNLLTDIKIMDTDNIMFIDSDNTIDQEWICGDIIDNLFSEDTGLRGGDPDIPPNISSITYLRIPQVLQDPSVSEEIKNDYIKLAKVLYEIQSSSYSEEIATHIGFTAYKVDEILKHVDMDGQDSVSADRVITMDRKLTSIFSYIKEREARRRSFDSSVRPQPGDLTSDSFFEKYFPEIPPTNQPSCAIFDVGYDSDISRVISIMSKQNTVESHNVIEILEASKKVTRDISKYRMPLSPFSIYLYASGLTQELRDGNIEELSLFKQLLERNNIQVPNCVERTITEYISQPQSQS